jgi:hypothetical protein
MIFLKTSFKKTSLKKRFNQKNLINMDESGKIPCVHFLLMTFWVTDFSELFNVFGISKISALREENKGNRK